QLAEFVVNLHRDALSLLFADRLHVGGQLALLLARFDQRLLDLLAASDVVQPDIDGGPIVIGRDARRRHCPEPRAVAALEQDLRIAQTAMRSQMPDQPFALQWVRVEVGDVRGHALAYAEQRAQRRVPVQDAPIQHRRDAQRHRTRFDDRAKARFARLQVGIGTRQFFRAQRDAPFEIVAYLFERRFRLLAHGNFIQQLTVLRNELLVHRAQFEMHADAREHLVDAQRLGHVIDTARGKPFDAVFMARQRGHEDHGDIARAFVTLEPPAGFEAVDAGHLHVEQNQIGLRERRAFERLHTVERNQHADAARLETVDDHADIGGRIVDDQDRARRHGGGSDVAHDAVFPSR
ncbi:conserved hypothetical protein, partial [Ricinus communis]